MSHVISKDGTRIYYEKKGTGPAIVLVSSAAADHNDGSRLGELLSEHFTVYNYDRRGRGDSADTAPYAVEREIEDLEALIQEAAAAPIYSGAHRGPFWLWMQPAASAAVKLASCFYTSRLLSLTTAAYPYRRNTCSI